MDIICIWEHNGSDTLLWCETLPGAYTRGASLVEALGKMEAEVRGYLRWLGMAAPETIRISMAQDRPCDLEIRDADSDVLFASEEAPLTPREYSELRERCLKSAADFQRLYDSIPHKQRTSLPPRRTFYGEIPRTAEEMYQHTKNVNAYYFAEIDVPADNDGTIAQCRQRGFDALEARTGFLRNPVIEGSYGESWSLRKLLRRFLWHDRIHAKAMYRMAATLYGADAIANPFCF